MKNWKKLSSKYVLDNNWIKVRQDTVRLPNKKVIDDYFVFEEKDVALIVPFTCDGKFVLVRQYKHALGAVTTEFPAGYIEAKEDPLKSAKRELREETGYASDNFILLKKVINSPTKIQSDINIFLANNCEPIYDQKQNLDDQEDIEIIVADPKSVGELIKKEEIIVTGTIAAFYLAKEKLGLG